MKVKTTVPIKSESLTKTEIASLLTVVNVAIKGLGIKIFDLPHGDLENAIRKLEQIQKVEAQNGVDNTAG